MRLAWTYKAWCPELQEATGLLRFQLGLSWKDSHTSAICVQILPAVKTCNLLFELFFITKNQQ